MRQFECYETTIPRTSIFTGGKKWYLWAYFNNFCRKPLEHSDWNFSQKPTDFAYLCTLTWSREKMRWAAHKYITYQVDLAKFSQDLTMLVIWVSHVIVSRIHDFNKYIMRPEIWRSFSTWPLWFDEFFDLQSFLTMMVSIAMWELCFIKFCSYFPEIPEFFFEYFLKSRNLCLQNLFIILELNVTP